MSPSPLFLSPATPPELAIYVSSQCVHPTTLVICTSQGEFDYALSEDLAREMRLHNPGLVKKQDDAHQDPDAPMDENGDFTMPSPADNTPIWISPLLQHSIHRLSIQKHIRVVFVPSVSHLRAWLTVLPPADPGLVPPPPPPAKPSTTTIPSSKSAPTPLLLCYGFLDLHRDTSEWSAQGLSNSASTLVEAARTAGLSAVVVEPKMDWHEENWDLEAVLGEEMPMLSGAERKAVVGGHEEEPGWVGRTVSVRRVLGRWFRMGEGAWEGLRDARDEDNG
ncbi:hypothetical protein GE09DRAFT_1226283 [Coniochaeta sp. 2T2.1]|nr:hypothetical protein GE09DRAFT_1226283 [Coniochaeta sp. 2T2.1]